MRLLDVKYVCCRSSTPDPAGGAYSAPLDHIAGIKGPASKEMKGQGRRSEGR